MRLVVAERLLVSALWIIGREAASCVVWSALMKPLAALCLVVFAAACAASPAEAPAEAGSPAAPARLTLEMSLRGCTPLEQAGVMRCTYVYDVGAESGVYEGDLQVTDLSNAPVLGVESSVAMLQPSMSPTDQICDLMGVANGPQVQSEMGHLGMNDAPTLYGWFCKTVDPAAAPPVDEAIHASADAPFRFSYTMDIDMSALAGAPHRNCAYLDWEGSGLTAPSQSPQACIDYTARG
jgi:hypothetical protein